MFFLLTNILLNAIWRVFVNGEHLLFRNSEPYWYIFLIRFSECEIRFTGPLISLTWIFFFNPCIRCVRNTIFFYNETPIFNIVLTFFNFVKSYSKFKTDRIKGIWSKKIGYNFDMKFVLKFSYILVLNFHNSSYTHNSLIWLNLLLM